MPETKSVRDQINSMELMLDKRDRQIKELMEYNQLLRDLVIRYGSQINSLFYIHALSGWRSMAQFAMGVADSKVAMEVHDDYGKSKKQLEALMRVVFHFVDPEDVSKYNMEHGLDLDAGLIEDIVNHPVMQIMEDIEIIKISGSDYIPFNERIEKYKNYNPNENSE